MPRPGSALGLEDRLALRYPRDSIWVSRSTTFWAASAKALPGSTRSSRASGTNRRGTNRHAAQFSRQAVARATYRRRSPPSSS